MGIRIYDADQVLYSSMAGTQYGPARTNYDGRLGGAQEFLIFVRNNDASKYYTDVQLSIVETTPDDSVGPYGDTGWSIKLLYGTRQPTEAEWDSAPNDPLLVLPDIGESGSANTATYFPVWVRIYAPGGIAAQLRSGQEIQLQAIEETV